MAVTAASRSASATRPTTSPTTWLVEVGAEEHLVAVGRPPADADLRPGQPDVADLVLGARVRAAGHEHPQRRVARQRGVGGQPLAGAGRVGDAEGAHRGAGAGADLRRRALAEQRHAPLGQAPRIVATASSGHVAEREVLVAGEGEVAVGVAVGQVAAEAQLGAAGVTEGEVEGDRREARACAAAAPRCSSPRAAPRRGWRADRRSAEHVDRRAPAGADASRRRRRRRCQAARNASAPMPPRRTSCGPWPAPRSDPRPTNTSMSASTAGSTSVRGTNGLEQHGERRRLAEAAPRPDLVAGDRRRRRSTPARCR